MTHVSPVAPPAPAGTRVYLPQADTHLLAEVLEESLPTHGAQVLDMCTGTGVLALMAARHGARVTAVDVSPEAVATARLNASTAKLPVHVVRGDLFAPVADRRFDLILSNPPYVPAPESRPPTAGGAVAWDAGLDGRALLDRICADAPPLLRPAGTLLLVHSALARPTRTLAQLRSHGLTARVQRRRRIPFGPVLRARAEWLRSRGLVAPEESMEELVVIRAERTR